MENKVWGRRTGSSNISSWQEGNYRSLRPSAANRVSNSSLPLHSLLRNTILREDELFLCYRQTLRFLFHHPSHPPPPPPLIHSSLRTFSMFAHFFKKQPRPFFVLFLFLLLSLIISVGNFNRFYGASADKLQTWYFSVSSNFSDDWPEINK